VRCRPRPNALADIEHLAVSGIYVSVYVVPQLLSSISSDFDFHDYHCDANEDRSVSWPNALRKKFNHVSRRRLDQRLTKHSGDNGPNKLLS